MVKILVDFEGKREEVELDTSESVEMFRYQLLSIFDVEPEKQEITGLGQGVLQDTAVLSDLSIQPGQVVTLKRAKPAPRLPADLFSTCSRVYLGDQQQHACLQPAAKVGRHVICLPCASSCARGLPLEPLLSETSVTCGCLQLCEEAGLECKYLFRCLGEPEVIPPSSSDLRQLIAVQLATKRTAFLSSLSAASASSSSSSPSAAVMPRINNQLEAYARGALLYEDRSLQARAREKIPLAELEQRAQAARDKQAAESRLSPRDALLKQLLHWFKHEFFSWVNEAPCDGCKGPTSRLGADRPRPEEAQYGAGIVEVFRCNKPECQGRITRFPRYNHAGKLLETRRGRCGEWTQAFTLCCRALGFEARSAHDWTDHVWTEVWSDAQGKWLHCDPCEAAMDQPYLYEAGWGKKLNYVISFSAEEVVDVTRRYTQHYEQVLTRRQECSEEWLAHRLKQLNEQYLSKCSPDRQTSLRARQEHEQRQLRGEARPELKAEEQKGRETGSLEWKSERGELGKPSSSAAAAASSPSSSEQPQGREEASPKPAEQQAMCSTSPATAPAPSSAPSSVSASDAPVIATGSAAATTEEKEAKQAAAPESITASAKEAVRKIFLRYLEQVQKGCGDSSCKNRYCKSNADVADSLPRTHTAAAKLCLELVTKQFDQALCSSSSTLRQ